MVKRKVGNLLALAVLSYLTQRPMHPYELQRSLKDNDAAHTFKLSYGALYSVVRQLASAGFIEELETEREGNRPERTVYRLTPAGAQEMGDWLRELLAEPQSEYPAFAAALSLIVVLPPEEAAALLTDRLGRIEAERAELSRTRDAAIAAGVHPVFLVEDEYRSALLSAEADFVAGFIDRIADADSDWAAPWRAHHAGAADQARS